MTETINERFLAFHEANPRVYDDLVRLALETKASGYTKYGFEELWARLRWERWTQTSGREDFKLNDHFTSRYARMLMQLNPELDGFFETRRLRGEEPDYRADAPARSLTRVEVVYGNVVVDGPRRGYAYDTDFDLAIGDLVLAPRAGLGLASAVATVVRLESDYTGDVQRIERVLERRPAALFS
jgi:hypothetical protein